MNGTLVDSNVLLDIFLNDPKWAEWSENTIERFSNSSILYINPVIYSEVSIGFEKIEELEYVIDICNLKIRPIPKEALFLAGKVFLKYKRNEGNKLNPLPDFFIGAQAAVEELTLITRDISRYKHYFPTVNIISPDSL